MPNCQSSRIAMIFLELIFVNFSSFSLRYLTCKQFISILSIIFMEFLLVFLFVFMFYLLYARYAISYIACLSRSLSLHISMPPRYVGIFACVVYSTNIVIHINSLLFHEGRKNISVKHDIQIENNVLNYFAITCERQAVRHWKEYLFRGAYGEGYAMYDMIVQHEGKSEIHCIVAGEGPRGSIAKG